MSDVCTSCGEPIFEVIPEITTSQAVMEFVDSSPWYSHADIQRDGSVLPGKYCVNGCAQAVEIEGNGAIVDLVDENYEESLTAKVVLLAESINIEEYKIYIDGYIEGAGNRDKDAEGWILIRVTPGNHRIVAREKQVNKADRRESNTIHFTVADSGEVKLQLSTNGNVLELGQC